MIDQERWENVINALELCTSEIETRTQVPCEKCHYHNKEYHGVHGNGCCNMRSLQRDILALLKAQEPRVMTLDLPPEEWQDKVIWLEIKGKKPIPCLFRKFCDRMMFGRYERIMSFDAIGSSKEGGYFLRNYGVTWRCWTARPTDAQREAIPWEG